MQTKTQFNDTQQKIINLLEHRKGERLIWDPIKPYKENGKKNQRWDLEKNDINWSKHFSGELKQGGRLSTEDGMSKCLVVDIDREKDSPLIPKEKICEDAFKLDHTLQIFKSPSENFHVYKFFHKPITTEAASIEAMTLGRAFKKLGYSVDFGKTLPKKNGSKIGINFPFHTHQQPLDVRGNVMTKEQFLHAYRFQNFPLIKAATNLKEGEGGRSPTLCMIAAQLEKKNGMKYLDEVIKNFGSKYDDEEYLNRIKEEGLHKTYLDIGPKGLSEFITNIVHFDYKIPYSEPIDNEPPPLTDESMAAFEDAMGFNKEENKPFEVNWIGEENYKIQPREWLMRGYLKAGNITLLQAPPGSMKTIVGCQMIYCGATGKPFMDHEILTTGNGLIICPEEDRNELELRCKGIEQFYGPLKHRVAIRGIEETTHLVRFEHGNLYPGKDYEAIKKFIKDNNIKYIHMDPLVSFQTGDFDENSNPQMDKYIKEILIPLARINNGCLILVHHSRKPQFQKASTSRTINPWESMNESRGASSLPAAARIVISLMPMTEGLWNALYKKLINESEIYRHIAIIDAKNNYASTNQFPLWCIKQLQEVRAENGVIIDIPVLQKSTLTELQNSKSAMHEEHLRKKCSEYIPIIESHFPNKDEGIQEVSLHSIAKEIVMTKTDISISKQGEIKKVVDDLKKGFNRTHTVNGIDYIYYYDRWDGKASHKIQRTDKAKKKSLNL